MSNKDKDKNQSKKINESSLKLFELLKLLYEDNADYNNVIDILKDDLKTSQSTNTIQVVLNKYINTLKVFGMNIIKENKKFKLLSSVYTMKLSLDDLKSINILTSSIKDFPDETLKDGVYEFLKNLTFRMNKEDKKSFDNINQTHNYNFSFKYLELKEQIKHCQELCKNNQTLDVVYLKDSEEIHTKCTPKELIYDSKNVYFKLYDIDNKQNIEISLFKILRIDVRPQVAKVNEMTHTVVYKLSGRLAKTYRLKLENEQSNGIDSEGCLTVINRNEPTSKLFQRLMRYGNSCEIISPKYVREEFMNLINKTLNNYEEG